MITVTITVKHEKSGSLPRFVPNRVFRIFHLPHLPCAPCALRLDCIEKIPGREKPQGFKQKGKNKNSNI